MNGEREESPWDLGSLPLEDEEEPAEETVDGAGELEGNQESTGSYKPREALVNCNNCFWSIKPRKD